MEVEDFAAVQFDERLDRLAPGVVDIVGEQAALVPLALQDAVSIVDD